MKSIKFLSSEKILFLVFGTISLLPMLLVKYVPSLDGPQHLYNARLIKELISGDELISQFFKFNPVIVGNLSSQYLMAMLMFVFPAWLSEKILLVGYVIGMALSFRYFTRSISQTASLLYLLIFPFAFHSLFMMGYYNFSMAFILFFLALGYLKRHENRLGIGNIAWLALLSLLMYLSHAIVFMFFGLVIVLQMIFETGFALLNRTGGFSSIISIIKKYLIIFVAAIPAIFLWGYYFLTLNSSERISPELAFIPAKDILGDLSRLRLLTGISYDEEIGLNMIMFWSLSLLVMLAFIPFHRFIKNHARTKWVSNPELLKWTFIVIVLFLLTIFLPDRFVTGSMTIRMSILFFFGVITWLSFHSFPKAIMIGGLLVVLAIFTWHRLIVLKHYKILNEEIFCLESAANHVKPGTIYYPINCSDNWLQPHFHCYLGVDKPVVDLLNPQSIGPFALLWNYTKMPDVLLGELDQNKAGVHWDYGNNNLPRLTADYIFIWKNHMMNSAPEAKTLYNKLIPYYTLTFKSYEGSAALYTLNERE